MLTSFMKVYISILQSIKHYHYKGIHYRVIRFFLILPAMPDRVLVLQSRLAAPLGPGAGIPFPYSCYIYDCSYLRGPLGYSMCFENPQHPPFRKARIAFGQDIITTPASWLITYRRVIVGVID